MPVSRRRKGGKKPSPLPKISPTTNHPLMAACILLRSLGRTSAKAIVHSWKLVGSASVVVGLVAGALFLFPPRLTIDLLGDSSDPYAVSFVVKNAWVLPMRNVTPFLGLCELN